MLIGACASVARVSYGRLVNILLRKGDRQLWSRNAKVIGFMTCICGAGSKIGQSNLPSDAIKQRTHFVLIS